MEQPITMTAAYLKHLREPLVIGDNIQVPTPEEGQVLVKLAYSGICHSQIFEAKGLRGDDPWLPHMLGHEGSGEVIATGPGVNKVKKGDKVVLGWIQGQGCNAPGAKYLNQEEVINSGRVTTFMEYAVVSESRVTPLPQGVPMDVAVLFGCALPTGAGIVLNQIQPQPGSSLLVLGLGGIGLSALIATQLFECSKVIAADIEDEKLAFAKEIGATDTIRTSSENLVERVMEITDGQGVDFAVEAAGLTQTIEQAFACLNRQSGRCVFASHPANGEKISIDPFELICGKRIEGSWGGSSQPDEDIPKFSDLYFKGKLPLEKMLSKPFTLDKINEAFELLESRKVHRALLEIDPSIKNN